MKVKIDENGYPVPYYFKNAFNKVCESKVSKELVEQWENKLEGMVIFYNNTASTYEFYMCKKNCVMALIDFLGERVFEVEEVGSGDVGLVAEVCALFGNLELEWGKVYYLRCELAPLAGYVSLSYEWAHVIMKGLREVVSPKDII